MHQALNSCFILLHPTGIRAHGQVALGLLLPRWESLSPAISRSFSKSSTRKTSFPCGPATTSCPPFRPFSCWWSVSRLNDPPGTTPCMTLPPGPKKPWWERKPLAAWNPTLSRGCILHLHPTLAMALCTPGLGLLCQDQERAWEGCGRGKGERAGGRASGIKKGGPGRQGGLKRKKWERVLMMTFAMN